MPLKENEEKLPLNYYKVYADCYLCYKYLPLVNMLTNATIIVIKIDRHALEPDLILNGSQVMGVGSILENVDAARDLFHSKYLL